MTKLWPSGETDITGWCNWNWCETAGLMQRLSKGSQIFTQSFLLTLQYRLTLQKRSQTQWINEVIEHIFNTVVSYNDVIKNKTYSSNLNIYLQTFFVPPFSALTTPWNPLQPAPPRSPTTFVNCHLPVCPRLLCTNYIIKLQHLSSSYASPLFPPSSPDFFTNKLKRGHGRVWFPCSHTSLLKQVLLKQKQQYILDKKKSYGMKILYRFTFHPV